MNRVPDLKDMIRMVLPSAASVLKILSNEDWLAMC
jgi:hypothetical protein